MDGLSYSLVKIIHLEIILNVQLNAQCFQMDLFFKIRKNLVVKHLEILKDGSTERAMQLASVISQLINLCKHQHCCALRVSMLH